MRILVVLLLTTLFATTARAGIVVWLHEDVPEDKLQEKADARTGGTKHLSGWDLQYPPMPPTDADEAAMNALSDAVGDGKKRWNDFEVEYGIAQQVGEALAEVTVLRDQRDLEEVVEALLFQGAAVQVAFEPAEFRDGERAEPFRFDRTGGVGNLPWSDAVGLLPEREPLASDVADGATYPKLREEVELYRDAERGTLTFPRRAPGDAIVVDGVRVADEELPVLPGLHFVHVDRDGVVSGRRVVRVASGRETAVEPYVPGAELAAARGRVLADTTTGFPESVRASLGTLAAHHGGAVFVAAHDENGRIVVLPWAHGAELLQQRKVTFVGTGEVGGALVSSPVFDGADGRSVLVPGVQGSLGFELGLWNVVLMGGADLTLTPGNTITYANDDNTKNIDTSTFAHPYAGAGLYLLRPTGPSATLLVAGHYTWLFPAHHGVGGRFSLGVPFEEGGNTWLRFTAGATFAGSTTWGTDDGMVVGFLRTGLATRF
jgi:hypothetical protein